MVLSVPLSMVVPRVVRLGALPGKLQVVVSGVKVLVLVRISVLSLPCRVVVPAPRVRTLVLVVVHPPPLAARPFITPFSVILVVFISVVALLLFGAGVPSVSLVRNPL